MTSIKETLRVACPYLRAREFLHQTLQEAAEGALPQLLTLTAHIPGTGIEMEKGVRVTYAHVGDPMHFDEPWTMSWTPEPGGTYPAFSGMLTVRADENYTTAVLEVEGSYEPPLGAAGQLFDKALGQRIASATLQNLLAKIAAEMVRHYDREEAAKIRA